MPSKTDEILKEFDLAWGRTTGPITPGLPHYDETLGPSRTTWKKKGIAEAGWWIRMMMAF